MGLIRRGGRIGKRALASVALYAAVGAGLVAIGIYGYGALFLALAVVRLVRGRVLAYVRRRELETGWLNKDSVGSFVASLFFLAGVAIAVAGFRNDERGGPLTGLLGACGAAIALYLAIQLARDARAGQGSRRLD